jgi:HPt (histidine-containing phosphotransfer) domain-containing protein
MEANKSGPRWANAPTLDTSVLEELRQYSEKEEDLASELIALFLEDSPKQLMALQQALRAADFGEVEKRSHRLKGSAGSIGAVRLREICESLELNARAGIGPIPASADADISAEMDALRNALGTVQKSSP